jgi:hypothetical protein
MIFALLLFTHATLAEPAPAQANAPAAPPEAKTPEAIVQSVLLEPLTEKDVKQSRYSRAVMPPRERRLRVDAQAHKDAQGASFVRFFVDERHGWGGDETKNWAQGAITGCVYVDKREVFVQRGEEFRPAAFLLGKNLKAAPESTCQDRAASRS